jgi:hypothetical protein
MGKVGMFLLVLVARTCCFPLLKDNSLDPQDDAVLYDETSANDTGLCHCVGLRVNISPVFYKTEA